jgi:Legionella pneumophila major outer membrane protein precursor
MNRFTKPALLLCLGLTVSIAASPAVAGSGEDISARFDRLEKENAALRARLNHLEAAKAAKKDRGPADVLSSPTVAYVPMPRKADGPADVEVVRRVPRFEISGSLMYLQPGAGNLEYGTLTTPLPLVTPSWANQSLNPNFTPAFSIAARYNFGASNDFELNWTHLTNTTNGSFFASPTQMVGPPYSIGPETNDYKDAFGTVHTAYDAINLAAGHTFCDACDFQLRAFGGVGIARIGQDLTGLFESPGAAESATNTNHSRFTGAGPRLGMEGQYALGDFRLIGELATTALVGTEQSSINFTTISPAAGLNNQVLTSPNATRVIPNIDARLAAAYIFPPSLYGVFKVEVGYRASVYIDAVSQYTLTQVPTALILPPTGIYLATQLHSQSNFVDQGPYVTAKWAFW